MRKRKVVILTLLLLVGLFCYHSANAQLFKGMIIAGGNLSQMDGDQVYGFKKIGWNTGLGVMAPLNKKRNFLMSMEVLYNQLGAKEKYDPFKYDATLHYASVPFLIHLEDKKGGWTFGVGLQYSRLFKVRESWKFPSPDTVKGFDRPILSTKKDFKRDDFSVIADIRFRIWEKLKFNIRYQYSFAPIRTNFEYFNGFPAHTPDYKSWKRNFYNNAITLRLIYVFNERSSKELDRNIRNYSY